MEARFLLYVEKTETCWLWTGAKTKGYGMISINNIPHGSHRVAYEMWVNPIPDGLFIRHKCRNKNCVNPEHLETGTQAENMADMVHRDNTSAKGEKHGLSKLTAEQVRDIRSRTRQTQANLAREFGVSKATISQITLHKTWSHIE